MFVDVCEGVCVCVLDIDVFLEIGYFYYFVMGFFGIRWIALLLGWGMGCEVREFE